MSITLAPPDVVALHRRAVERVAALIATVPADRWDDPTPCAGWSVGDLVAHLVAEDLWAAPLLRGATIEEVGDAFAGDVIGDDAVAAFRAAADRADTAIAEGPLDRVVHLSAGDAPAEEYLWQLFADHLVHGWDLAQSLGADDAMPDDLVEACAGWFDTAEAAYRQAGAIGPRPTVPVDADPQTRLLARFGRSATRAVVERFGHAFDRQDLDAVMATTTPDCVFEGTRPPDGDRAAGADAVRAAFRAVFEASPTARFDTEEVVVAGDRAVVRWHYRWEGGHVRGIDLFTVRDGKVAEKLAYVKG